jgi:CheY-like chemotaxis protein
LRVLVVEDNSDAAETLEAYLQALGHVVATAGDGKSALERAREFGPDLVLCDIGLPGGLDGYAVARAFRAEPRFGETLLVALTGYAQREDLALAKRSGFDVHLAKPVDAKSLEETLSMARDFRRAD